jgi:hypothetical protein
LREWRGVKPVAAPAGVAVATRLRTSAQDERVLDLVAEHVGRLRRADLARVVRPEAVGPVVDGDGLRQARRDRLNARKSGLTAQSSARWASAAWRGYRLRCSAIGCPRKRSRPESRCGRSTLPTAVSGAMRIGANPMRTSPVTRLRLR